jgi:hypothetical protein
MELWQQTVETRLGELRSDLRGLDTKVGNNFLWILGVYGAGFVLLSGGVITIYFKLADKIDGLGSAVEKLTNLVAAIPHH